MNTIEKRPYNFKWKDIGNIETGRPNLGQNTSVAVYRLMQYSLRAALLKEFGEVQTIEIFREAGKYSGIEFCKNVLNIDLNLNEFFAELHQKLIDFSIGILKIEKADIEK